MDAVAQKPKYTRPELRSLGSLAELTLGNGSAGFDSCSLKAKNNNNGC